MQWNNTLVAKSPLPPWKPLFQNCNSLQTFVWFPIPQRNNMNQRIDMIKIRVWKPPVYFGHNTEAVSEWSTLATAMAVQAAHASTDA